MACIRSLRVRPSDNDAKRSLGTYRNAQVPASVEDPVLLLGECLSLSARCCRDLCQDLSGDDPTIRISSALISRSNMTSGWSGDRPGTLIAIACNRGSTRAWLQICGGQVLRRGAGCRALAQHSGREKDRLMGWHISPEPRWLGFNRRYWSFPVRRGSVFGKEVAADCKCVIAYGICGCKKLR